MKSVLVVEDDKLLGRMISSAITKAGYEVYWAEQSREAFEALAAQPIDLILLDIILPEEDGFSILSRLKKHPDFKDIPVVMLTNLSEVSQMDRAHHLGAVDYLIKSNIEITDLTEKIRHYL